MLYQTNDYNLSGLQGISDATLETHFKLYEGYVQGTNSLLEKMAELRRNGKNLSDKLVYSELKRRLGFEYNGMVLHELYFSNLTKNGGGNPAEKSNFMHALKSQWESYDAWKQDFLQVGEMRGVGWAICYRDNATGYLNNHWITLHETGNIAGFSPILVMDVWEHAFMLDYKPPDRAKYIEAFFSNINWQTVESRMHTPAELITATKVAIPQHLPPVQR